MDPLAGVPESALDERVDLPPTAPPAPWTCRCDAIVWITRPGRRWPSEASGARPLLVAGALLRYADSPVGEYHEVLGVLAGLGRNGPIGTVPFIAVDSAASLVGGRRNWALPKTFAQFAQSQDEQGRSAMTATGAGWTVAAAARTLGPAVPVPLAGRLRQPWPDGRQRTARLIGRASAAPALVAVTVTSTGPLAGWLRPGRHFGLLLRRAEFTLAAPAESLAAPAD